MLELELIWKDFGKGVAENGGGGESFVPIVLKKKKYYKESRKKEEYYIQPNDGSLTGLVTWYVGTGF